MTESKGTDPRPVRDLLQANAAECSAALQALAASAADEIAAAADRIAAALGTGAHLWTFGNGGSAADAQHIAAELSGRFLLEREALPATALTTNPSALTAIGNDYGFDQVFERQLRGVCRAADVALGISTSGSSPNVVNALRCARERGAFAIALTGADGRECARVADLSIRVPARATPRIQECHIFIGHALCQLVEERIFPQ